MNIHNRFYFTNERSFHWLRWACIILGAAYCAIFLALTYVHLTYPFEIEWMEGSMVEHAIRILDGRPIYTAPSIDFVPWLYPPLYYYVAAGAMKLFGTGLLAARAVSVSATILTAILLASLTKRVTASNLSAFLSATLYLGAFAATGYYFDLVRMDSTLVLLLVATTVVASRWQSIPGVCAAALLLSLAFFTKQQASFFLPGLALWYWILGTRSSDPRSVWWMPGRRVIIFLVVSIGMTVMTLEVANHATDGWLFFYLFRIPSAYWKVGFSWSRALTVLPTFLLGRMAISSLALVALVVIAMMRSDRSFSSQADRMTDHPRAFWSSTKGLVVLMALCAMASCVFSIGNYGGYLNVLMPAAAFMAPLLPILLGETRHTDRSAVQNDYTTDNRWWTADHPPYANLVLAAVLLQFLALYSDPREQGLLVPREKDLKASEAFVRVVRDLPGEVFIPYHTIAYQQTGKQTHAQYQAVVNTLVVGDTTAIRLRADYDSAYAHHRFGAIICDEPTLGEDILSHYRLSAKLPESQSVVARIGSGMTRTHYLFLPR